VNRRPEHRQILILKKFTFYEEYFVVSSVFISCSQPCFICMFFVIYVLPLECNMWRLWVTELWASYRRVAHLA